MIRHIKSRRLKIMMTIIFLGSIKAILQEVNNLINLIVEH